MSDIPDDLLYSKSHEWARAEDDGSMTVGITDYAQDQMGDMVYVEVPEIGHTVDAGQTCAVVESVKSASDVYSPVAGEVLEINTALADNAELVNKDPYGDGWLFRLKPSDPDAIGELMDASSYSDFLASEAH